MLGARGTSTSEPLATVEFCVPPPMTQPWRIFELSIWKFPLGSRNIPVVTPPLVLRLRRAGMALVAEEIGGNFSSRVVEFHPLQAHSLRFSLAALGDDGMTGVAVMGDGPA